MKKTVDPLPGVEDSLLRLPLLGAVFSAVIHQRGFLGLHASAVAIDGHAVEFLWEPVDRQVDYSREPVCARPPQLLADDLVVYLI